MEAPDSIVTQVDLSTHIFIEPTKQITDQSQVPSFIAGNAAKQLLTFVVMLQTSAKGMPISFTKIPESLQVLYDFLDKSEKWIDEIPPIPQPMRFGNKSFRTWYEKVKDNLESELFELMLPTEQLKASRIELYPYLLDSFGSYE